MRDRALPENAPRPLPAPYGERLDRMIGAHGPNGTAKRLGVVHTTVEVLAYGGKARPPTVARVVEALDRVAP